MAPRPGQLALIASLAASAVLLVFLAFDPLGEHATTVVSDLVQIAVPLFVAVPLCALAAARATGQCRWSWALIGIGCASWGLGQAAWTYYELVAHTEPFPSPADLGFLGSVPFLVLGVARHPASVLRLGRLRIFVDGAIIATALVFAATATFLGEIWDANQGTFWERTLLILYPACDVLVVAVAIALLARRPGGWRGSLGLLLAGNCFLAIADAAFCWITATSVHADEITDAGWPIGFALLALAAHRDVQVTAADADEAQATRVVEAWVPQVPVALAGAALVARGVLGDGIGPALAGLLAFLILLVLARQAMVQLENGELATVLQGTVSQLEAREDELEFQAFHDPLTGLANRALFRDRLQHAASRRVGPEVAVLFVDLDDFKTVNDTMGHDVGDQILVLVAERLRACLRPGDTAARLGGDEFAVLLDDDHAARAAGELGSRILAALEVPFTVGGRELRARASVGIVTGERGLVGADQLLQDADLAMYAAKAVGGSRIERFDPTMRTDARDRLDLLGDLDGVLERDELELHHQPIVRLTDGEVAGHEVLLRWLHPTRGMLAPGAFLDLAEEAGHMGPIGWWVLEDACRGAAARGGEAWVSVNVATSQLHEVDCVEHVAAILERTGLEARRVVLEVTERALTEGVEVVARLGQLRDLGVRIAIDDFGTGYSSLAALVGLPLDALKIDGSFVARLGTPEGEVLVQAVIDLAKALGLRTVAEGVEQPWQLEKVVALGCDGAQGFLLGRPSPVPATTAAVRVDVLAR